MAITLPNPNLVLYGNGLFNTDNPANQTQLQLIQASGFTSVILWTLHVDSSGDLIYNGNPAIVSNGKFNSAAFGYLPALVSALKASSSGVQLVLFSIGSADTSDWTTLGKLLSTSSGRATLQSNFSALSTALAIDGYDFDDEDNINSGVIASMTELLAGIESSMVTYCPFNLQNVWNGALVDAYNSLSSQPVQWFNLQCYAGGAGNDPVQWEKSLPTNAGIADPQSFIIPGYSSSSMSPLAVQNQFATFAGKGINGGFIWNSGQIFSGSSTLYDYAQAMANGLKGIKAKDAA